MRRETEASDASGRERRERTPGSAPHSPAPSLPQPIHDEVARLWPETAALSWTALTPDGSDRTYWRLDGGGRSVVLMVYRGQNATPVEGFLEVHRLLESAELPVARIEAASPGAGLFLLEDLGDLTLEAVAAGLAPERLESLYEDAVELLVRIQAVSPTGGGPRARCFELAFDEPKLLFEMDFFYQHLVADFLGLDPAAPEASAARTELAGLCRSLARRHPVLAHRDYHSRNLMVQAGRLRLIDYQDARLGRHSYDLASLLYDSYLDVGEAERERLVDHYERLAGKRLPEPLPADWRDELVPTAVQRNLKALGSFGFLMGKKRKMHFATAVGRTLRHLASNLPSAGLPATAAFVLGPLAERCRELGLAPETLPRGAAP
jgi:N-acetylmuramate 1-kinase